MKTFVLIIVSVIYGGHTVTTQEFNSEESCRAVQKFYNDQYAKFSEGLVANCFSK